MKNASVRADIREIEGLTAYVLEILQDTDTSDDARALGAALGHLLGQEYAKFRYIVPLE